VRWFRNKEFRIFFFFILLLSISGIAACFFYPQLSMAIMIAVCLLFTATAYFFAKWRYKKLAELSEYLKSVNNGHYNLAVPDHDEGELSILKSEIYKATIMLCVQAEALKKEKSELADAMSDISHQLKTPLTSMMVMTDLLCDPTLPAGRRIEFTGLIRAQLERIEWLVTSLLKLSRLDAGTIVFNKVPVKMDVLLNRALAPLLIPIELRRQTVTVSHPEITFSCDLNWTAEALLNIFKNCVEHTAVGGSLSITAFQNALYTQIVIFDNGSGIHAADLPHIFERFYRGSNAGEDSVGIGLAMSKSMIALQGGSITVKSTVGTGTTFTINFYG